MKEIEDKDGNMVLLYGPTGVGKSTTCLAGLPQPILNINTEDRNPFTSIKALKEPVDFNPVSPESNQDLIDFMYKCIEEVNDNTFKYKSVMFDSSSFWMNIKLYGEMVDQTNKAEIFKKSKRPLVDGVRADEALYGGLAERMQRTIKPFKILSQMGVLVVWLAYETEFPKWDKTLAAAPNYIGRAWNKNYEQHFDVIGKLSHRLKRNEDGEVVTPHEVVYPPIVSVKSPDDDFVCKWTGRNIKGNSFPLDFSKMLQLK